MGRVYDHQNDQMISTEEENREEEQVEETTQDAENEDDPDYLDVLEQNVDEVRSDVANNDFTLPQYRELLKTEAKNRDRNTVTELLRRKVESLASDDDEDKEEKVECPECGEEFDTEEEMFEHRDHVEH